MGWWLRRRPNFRPAPGWFGSGKPQEILRNILDCFSPIWIGKSHNLQLLWLPVVCDGEYIGCDELISLPDE